MTETKVTKIPVTEEARRQPNVEQSAARLVRSLLRAGMNLTMLPIAILPEEPRRHIVAARRETILGIGALLRFAAESLEEAGRESKHDEVEPDRYAESA